MQNFEDQNRTEPQNQNKLPAENFYRYDAYSVRDAGGIFVLSLLYPLLIEFAAMIIIVPLVGIGVDGEIPVWALWTLTALGQFAFLLAVYHYSRRRRINYVTAVSARKKITPAQILILAGIAGVSLFLFDPFVLLFEKLLELLGYVSSAGILGDINTVPLLITALLVAAVLPALCEEALFRGAITNGLTSGIKKWKAILLSGLIFALAHQNPDQTVYQLLFGCLLAFIFLTTGSLWSTALVHFLNNAVIIVIQYINSQTAFLEGGGTESFGELLGGAALLTVILAPVMAGLLYALIKTVKRDAAATEGDKAESPVIRVFKAPFADEINPDPEREENMKKIAEQAQSITEQMAAARERYEIKAGLIPVFGGLAFCAFMWALSFFGVL